MDLIVARIGRPHGIKGEVSVELRTDNPTQRLAEGSVLRTDPAAAGPLHIQRMRVHNGVTLLTFEGVADRDAAETLRNVLLVVEASADADEEDAWHTHELVGLAAEHADTGVRLGTVTGLEFGAAQDLLVVRPEAGGPPVRVPFVHQLVPSVEVAAGRVLLRPPGGLFPTADSGQGTAHDATGAPANTQE